ncbi:hypothetical protein BJX99DRAFT_224628 [Aspergillus californicus]
MNPLKLQPAAEIIRLEIKAMIPELSNQTVKNRAEVLKTEGNGNKTYGGQLLAAQIPPLARQLPIPDPENWGWRLLYFAVPTTATTRKGGFVIPLSEKTIRQGILKEGESQEGLYFEVATGTETEVNSETAAIYFVPR